MDATDRRQLAWFCIILGTALCLFGVFSIIQGVNGPRWPGGTVALVSAFSLWSGLLGLLVLPLGILLLSRAPPRSVTS